MEKKDHPNKEAKVNLTNEEISKHFDNQFDLVNYAISVAEEMIHAGRGPRVKTQTENPALQVLAEIIAGKDSYEEAAYKVEHRIASIPKEPKVAHHTHEKNSEKVPSLVE